jgi:hypothetical protein
MFPAWQTERWFPRIAMASSSQKSTLLRSLDVGMLTTFLRLANRADRCPTMAKLHTDLGIIHFIANRNENASLAGAFVPALVSGVPVNVLACSTVITRLS